jgi:rhodanese-related sulfurtransferase
MRWGKWLTGILAVALLAGCAATTAQVAPAPVAALAKVEKKDVAQDPKLAITTVEVMQLLASPEAGNYVLVDARPEVKFNEGHVPGALSIPKPMLEQNLDKLPKDKTIIFYCGGLKCELSPQSAEIAMKNGFDQVKVWYEGEPAWTKAGNYLEVELPYIEKLVTKGGTEPFLLVDSRPALKYNQSFIPKAVSLPKAEFDLKKGLLPADKSLPVIFYCGGYKCKLSHESADLAVKLGYTKVAVFAAGEPAWKDAGLAMWGNEASGVVAKPKIDEGGLPESITADEFKKLVGESKVQVVDVRSKEDFAAGHLAGAIHIFDEDFIFKAKESVAKLPTEGRVVLHCSTGGRAGGAYYAILGESDYVNKKNLQYLDKTITVAADGTFVIE